MSISSEDFNIYQKTSFYHWYLILFFSVIIWVGMWGIIENIVTLLKWNVYQRLYFHVIIVFIASIILYTNKSLFQYLI